MSSNSQRNFSVLRVAAFLVAATLVFKSVVAAESELDNAPSGSESVNVSDLVISTRQVDFGGVTPGEAESAIVVFTNNGTPESGPVVIDNLFLDEWDSQFYTLSTSAPITLEPSESIDLLIGFEPDKLGPLPGRLTVSHSGKSGVDVIDLNGEGVDLPIISAANPISLPFGKSSLTGFNGGKPTSLQFGPDGRLYVAFMDGDIHVLDVERKGSNEYAVTDTDAITLVKGITNHNDDGTVKTGLNKRLVTGLLVSGTASKPVIYVLSSDPRIGGGKSGNTTGLDTNSGVLSRLTKTSNGWKKLDLVRGLPRSEENHHSNGMALVGSTLYVASGGHTNMGAMSNNFAMLPEYALSAAILSIDLDQIGENTYDLPTLDDEDRSGPVDENDPFGGNGGKNQAMLVADGPVQVYAPGFRNPYDVVAMKNGKLYSWDNGPNSGWGGSPGGCFNARKEPGSTQHDALHLITGPGYYAGHPNPTRGSQKNKFNKKNPQSPVPFANPIECNYYGPGTNGNGKHHSNHALVSLPRSTNGLAEYTASNLSGAMTGNLLAVSWNNKVYRVSFKASGALEDINVLFSNVGISPLDITAQSDNNVFPGTIWVADLQSQKIIVYEPDDYEGGGSGIGGCIVNGGNSDGDNDGFTDADEIANGTDACSAADVPADVDGDQISDLVDPDDDNDNILDVDDPFAIDSTNGASTPLPVDYQWENDSDDPGFIASLGFTGLMNNGIDNYQEQFDLNEMTIIGAAGVLTVDNVPDGDPLRGKNSQQFGFQFGIDVGPSSEPFRVQTRILAPFSGFVPKLHQSMGIFIGNGDQDNYLKLIVKHNVVQLLTEVGGELYFEQSDAAGIADADYVDLTIEVDPTSAIATAYFQITRDDQSEQEVQMASVDFPATWLSGSTKLAVGILSTSTKAQTFPATWDFLTVKPLETVVANQAPTVEIPAVGDITVGAKTPLSAIVSDDGLPADTVTTQWSLLSGPAAVTIDDSTHVLTAMTFSKEGVYELQLEAEDGEFTTIDTVTIKVIADAASDENVVYRINAGGPLISATDGDWQSDSASAQYANTGYTWSSNATIDISGINGSAPAQLFGSERYDRAGGPELEWALPVTPGEYVVRLYFSEIYFGAMKAGGRVFDVSVEGQVETGLDVFASVGANTAMMKSYTVQADDMLNIGLSRVVQNPAIKGIEVLKAAAPVLQDDPITPPENLPPLVNAGSDKTAKVSSVVVLSGEVFDDGLPAGAVANSWSLISGPASPQFSAFDSAVTEVTFPVPGLYLLRLSANDGALIAYDDVQIDVSAIDPVINQAPVVTAITNTSVSTGSVSLSGTVSDDGLPENQISVEWSMQSGPAAVLFDRSDLMSTTASFSQAGDYVLRLSANDTDLTGYDELTITIEDEPVLPTVFYRINTGGPLLVDSNGNWAADLGASPLVNTGRAYSLGVAIDTSRTPGIPEKLFQSERWDAKSGAEMTWKLPVAPGSYDVNLYFSEIYSGAKGNGKRVFTVAVEGQTLSALDVFAEAGADASLVKTFSVENTDGVINIDFSHMIENPSIKGIEVIGRP
ncbi:MAG: malectin domain-containing carbohydrate-binding protein [Granulosicoccus sp.]